MQTIENILTGRSAFLKGPGGDKNMAEKRRDLTMAIQQNYPAFEVLRDKLLGTGSPKSAVNAEPGLDAARTHLGAAVGRCVVLSLPCFS